MTRASRRKRVERDMRLVERAAELTELMRLLEECAPGRGGAAVVSGGIGCGKTELLSAVRDAAVHQGFLVLSAVGSWAERESPGSVVFQLLRGAEGTLGAHEELAVLLDRVTRRSEYLTGEEGDGPAAGFGQRTLDAATTQALHRLCLAVIGAAAHRPVLLCVDDVQFTDSLSLYWLLRLLRRAPAVPIVVLVAECTLSRPAHPQLHAELLSRSGYRRIPLARLSVRGVAELIADQLGALAQRVPASDCHAVSGGNPLLVRALVEDHRRAGEPGARAVPRLVVGDAYAEAVLSCIHRGRPVLLRLAQALAVLDADVEPSLLSRLLGEDEATMCRGTSALEAAGLLGSGRLHPVARTAVLESLAPRQRSALHARSAELLYRDGAPATTVARLLLASDDRGRSPWAKEVLCDAAERHLAGHRLSDAHACLEAALRICGDDQDRVGIKALFTGTAWMLNPSISARHLGELATALRDGRLPDRHALPLAKFLLWHGRFDEAVEAVERLGEGRPECDPAAVAEIRATRELLATTYPDAVRPPDARPGRSRHIGRAQDDPRVLGAAALAHVLAHGPDDDAVADAEAAMRTMRLSKSTQEWIVCAVSVLEFSDRLDAAVAWCDHWLEQARTRRVPLWEAEFASLRARVALRQGDPPLARRLAQAALARVPAESWGVCIAGPLANLVQAATRTGDHDAASDYLEVPVPAGLFRSRFGLYFLQARGRFHLQTGRPYAALDDFTACGDLMRSWGFDQPTLVPWRSEAAHAHLAVGDVERARVLAGRELDLVGRQPSRARGIALRAVAACGPDEGRLALLTEAVTLLRGCGDRLELASALADLARVRVAAGQQEQARQDLRSAVRLATAAGALPLVRTLTARDATGREDASAASGPAGLALLSDAERRVADLAARGHTNREIAGRLAVTPSTVEQHLTRVFRKLGVRTRQELPVPDAAASGAD
ncbi:regulatory LuxR family protein [Streptomyces sp. BK208]|uniref:AAA family ATPase n=1 Tax=Streptomyces sp. BK208 TaxID=2512150 RepID=UPI001060F5FA|nr:LuxR family transcriptional regulator [Streptomyces sp. BK208]TDT42691.1 regulatory LuxR family protein [Streptomyces sp. BK208]